MTPILKFIPMPVLYGVFLYMGIAPLADMHFYDRIRIMFMPPKYQPDFNYLRKVPLKRVHLFTVVQLICFAILWIVKTNETISISFPLMVLSVFPYQDNGSLSRLPFCISPTVGDHDICSQISGFHLHQRRATRPGHCYSALPPEEAQEGYRGM